jgi:hypothetical protein
MEQALQFAADKLIFNACTASTHQVSPSAGGIVLQRTRQNVACYLVGLRVDAISAALRASQILLCERSPRWRNERPLHAGEVGCQSHIRLEDRTERGMVMAWT